MTLLNSKTADNAQDLLDYQVVDQSGEDIGTLHCFWADPQSGKLEFIGVKTGWLFGHNHVIPIEKVEIDDAARVVRIPYASEFVKGAMSIDADSEISESEEAEIYRYYGVGGSGSHDMSSASSLETRSASTEVGATAARMKTDLSAPSTAASAKTAASGESIEVPLTEERVSVGKRQVAAGQVRLRKVIRTEIVNQPVELHHEDVIIERVSAAEVRQGGAVTDFTEKTIEVPLTREEVVVQKDSHVTGAVRVHKTDNVEKQTVSETVRKEDVEVDKSGTTSVTYTETEKADIERKGKI